MTTEDVSGLNDEWSDRWREDAAEYAAFHREPRQARLAARAWRTEQRAANLAPLRDKVVYPRRLVDAPPPPKKGRGK